MKAQIADYRLEDTEKAKRRKTGLDDIRREKQHGNLPIPTLASAQRFSAYGLGHWIPPARR